MDSLLCMTRMSQEGLEVFKSSQHIIEDIAKFICDETFPNGAKPGDITELKYQKGNIYSAIFTHNDADGQRSNIYGLHLVVSEKIHDVQYAMGHLAETFQQREMLNISDIGLSKLLIAILSHANAITIDIDGTNIDVPLIWEKLNLEGSLIW